MNLLIHKHMQAICQLAGSFWRHVHLRENIIFQRVLWSIEKKTTSTLPFTLEMYAEPQTRVELIITELPGTILVKIDTDTNPNRQGGLFSNIHIPHTVTDKRKSEQALTRRKHRRQPSQPWFQTHSGCPWKTSPISSWNFPIRDLFCVLTFGMPLKGKLSDAFTRIMKGR